MATVKILFTLFCLASAVTADEYCYTNDSGILVCRNRLATGARIAIVVAGFVIISAIFLAYTMNRRRRIARANMAFIPTSQDQQQGQYPPQTQGGSLGMPFGGNGQKPQSGYDQYNPQPTGQYDQQYTGQPQYNAQLDPQYTGQYNTQHNGQYQTPYSPPQYPPTAYDQGNPNQPAPPYPGYAPPQH